MFVCVCLCASLTVKSFLSAVLAVFSEARVIIYRFFCCCWCCGLKMCYLIGQKSEWTLRFCIFCFGSEFQWKRRVERIVEELTLKIGKQKKLTVVKWQCGKWSMMMTMMNFCAHWFKWEEKRKLKVVNVEELRCKMLAKEVEDELRANRYSIAQKVAAGD